MSLLSWAFTPDAAINYDFVATAYAVLALVSVFLLVLEKGFHNTSVEGWWIVVRRVYRRNTLASITTFWFFSLKRVVKRQALFPHWMLLLILLCSRRQP